MATAHRFIIVDTSGPVDHTVKFDLTMGEVIVYLLGYGDYDKTYTVNRQWGFHSSNSPTLKFDAGWHDTGLVLDVNNKRTVTLGQLIDGYYTKVYNKYS